MINLGSRLVRTALVVVVFLGISGMAHAETVNLVFKVTTPDSTSGLSVFLAGNFQNWNPGDNNYRLDDAGDGLYEISLPAESGKIIHFKFTQGNWATVEKGSGGEELANRSLRVDGPGVHKFHVASWAHQHPESKPASTLAGNVEPVAIPDFLDGRDVLVYLPPDYNTNPARHYPVLYMFDGQNVFDAATSFAGEWNVDESCEKLITGKKMRPVIVVAIANGGQQRINEYTPWSDPNYKNSGSGGGKEHLQTIVTDLIPFINKNYRTLTGPQNTGLAGSSLGGLMALYAAGKHQDTFGLFAALSPSLWWHDGFSLDFAQQNIEPGIVFYTDMGAMENSVGENSGSYSLNIIQRLKTVLENNGFSTGANLMVVEDEMGEHNESSWAKRFPTALVFLFPLEEKNH